LEEAPAPAVQAAAVAVIGNVAVDVRWPLARGYGKKYCLVPRRTWGGYPAAAARPLLALGVAPRTVSGRGPGGAGEFVAKAARQAGLDVRWLRLGTAPTREAQVLEHEGERTILLESRPFARWEPTVLDEPPLCESQLWCAGGTLDPPGND